jgi:thiamine-monophosphate kinase
MGERITSETELIETFLAPLTEGAKGAFGLRDDAAVITPAPGTDIVVTTDPIVEAVHFFPDDSPADIAWKALAVNVSDIAAKGAEPFAYSLNLAFREAPRRDWVAAFTDGLRLAQQAFGCRLIGGDTDRTPGSLSIGVTMFGSLPAGTFVPRGQAQAGDHVFATGTIGDAALGLAIRRDPSALAHLSEEQRAFLVDRYLRPQPRLALAETLRRHATASLDISDGLLKDLARLAGSHGLDLSVDLIPLSEAARSALAHEPGDIEMVLAGGGDYELLIAVPRAAVEAFTQDARASGVAIRDLGVLKKHGPMRVLGTEGTEKMIHRLGFDHFSS